MKRFIRSLVFKSCSFVNLVARECATPTQNMCNSSHTQLSTCPVTTRILQGGKLGAAVVERLHLAESAKAVEVQAFSEEVRPRTKTREIAYDSLLVIYCSIGLRGAGSRRIWRATSGQRLGCGYSACAAASMTKLWKVVMTRQYTCGSSFCVALYLYHVPHFPFCRSKAWWQLRAFLRYTIHLQLTLGWSSCPENSQAVSWLLAAAEEALWMAMIV